MIHGWVRRPSHEQNKYTFLSLGEAEGKGWDPVNVPKTPPHPTPTPVINYQTFQGGNFIVTLFVIGSVPLSNVLTIMQVDYIFR